MPRAKAAQPDMLDGVAAHKCTPMLQEGFDLWNEQAKGIPNWSAVTVFNNKQRCNRLRDAIETSGGLVGWRKMLTDAAKSDVLTGRASWTKGSKWFTFDWLTKPANLVKVLEGNYKNPEAESITFAQQLKGVGVRARYAEVAKPFVQTETLEQRLAASIVIYRKYSKWAEANRVEDKLAAIEKRPAVHVPAPEVAHVGMPERAAEIPRRPAYPVTDLVDEYDIPEAPDYGGDE